MKPALMLSLLLLSGCVADPRLNAGISIGTGGISVHPGVSARVGPARVTLSP